MAIDPNSTAVTNITSTGNVRSITNLQQPPRSMPPLHHFHHHTQHPNYSTHPSLYTAQPLSLRPNSSTPTQSSSSPAQGILYPVSSSGRGFIQRPIRTLPTSDQAVTVVNPNPAGYFYRPLVGLHQTASAAGVSVRPNLDLTNHNHNHNHSVHILRPPHNFQQQHSPCYPPIVSTGGPIKSVPVSGQSKVASASSVPDSNGYKDTRDKNKDDNIVIVKDRKVRITDEASLYALCRSWLRNGLTEESQSQYGDVVRSLPKPLPIVSTSADMLKRQEHQEEEEEEDKESVRHLSKEDLLERHVKHAKKVRARLREERLKRIARYKSRLALLLPPLVEQQFRNDAYAGI